MKHFLRSWLVLAIAILGLVALWGIVRWNRATLKPASPAPVSVYRTQGKPGDSKLAPFFQKSGLPVVADNVHSARLKSIVAALIATKLDCFDVASAPEYMLVYEEGNKRYEVFVCLKSGCLSVKQDDNPQTTAVGISPAFNKELTEHLNALME